MLAESEVTRHIHETTKIINNNSCSVENLLSLHRWSASQVAGSVERALTIQGQAGAPRQTQIRADSKPQRSWCGWRCSFCLAGTSHSLSIWACLLRMRENISLTINGEINTIVQLVTNAEEHMPKDRTHRKFNRSPTMPLMKRPTA